MIGIGQNYWRYRGILPQRLMETSEMTQVFCVNCVYYDKQGQLPEMVGTFDDVCKVKRSPVTGVREYRLCRVHNNGNCRDYVEHPRGKVVV